VHFFNAFSPLKFAIVSLYLVSTLFFSLQNKCLIYFEDWYYFNKDNYLAKKLKYKNNLEYVLLVSLKDEKIAFDMAIDGKRSMDDIDYQCIIESIFDDDMKEKEKIFKEFAKEFKNLDGLINDAIIFIQKRKSKTPVSYLQRKLQIGYNRAAKIKNQVCMFGLLEEKDGK